jgi:hypothetical protein
MGKVRMADGVWLTVEEEELIACGLWQEPREGGGSKARTNHVLRFRPHAFNVELFHAGFESGGVETEDFGCALLAADAPVGLIEHIDDVLAFHFFERQCLPLADFAV